MSKLFVSLLIAAEVAICSITLLAITDHVIIYLVGTQFGVVLGYVVSKYGNEPSKKEEKKK